MTQRSLNSVTCPPPSDASLLSLLHSTPPGIQIANSQTIRSTSGVSDRTTSIPVVCQRPPKCYPSNSAAFRRRRQDCLTTLTKRPFAELPQQCLELVGKLGPPYQFYQMQQYRCWSGSSSSIIICHWKSGQFHTCCRRCYRPGRSHGQFLHTLHPLQSGCLQSKTNAVYDKAVVH